ncbi:MAG: ASKHA domain-containing protein [Chloroflexi bacterium]|nr:ASKHA domain-containing protein [Chloroflexota bacterium]
MVECKVIFQPSGRRGLIEQGKTLLEAARELGVEIETVCGEKHTCGKCKVRIEEGFFQRHGIESGMGHLSPVTQDELKFIKEADRANNTRLACQTRVQGDVLVFVPEISRRTKQIVRKAATERAITLAPAVKKYYVELPKPSLVDSLGDFERLSNALTSTYELTGLEIDYAALKGLPAALRNGDWKVTASIWQNRRIIAIEPGFVEDTHGLAVDIGTTTVVGFLTEMRSGKVLATESMMNPQVAYGEDVMSRITYAMSQEDGLEKMHAAIVEGLNTIARRAAAQAGIRPEDILEMVVVGNTVMHHIFLNIDPRNVGMSPFTPARNSSIDVRASDLGLKINPSANVHVLPNEAGFVGADNVGVLLAEEPYNQDEAVLIIDIGTNGELVLGNRHKMISCSCATGPALEGAHINFGMRAAPGAIERIKIDPHSLDVQFKVIGKAEWHTSYPAGEVGAKGICGSGIIDAVAEMFKAGVLQRNGAFAKNLDSPRLTKSADGRPQFVIARAEETSIGQDITVSLKDVRAVQLAKGALYCGAKILLRRFGVSHPDRVILAGAFGSYIDREQAMVLGLFPDCDLNRVYSVGNAAGDGARIALLNAAKRAEADEVARRVEYVELATEPDFSREFTDAMYFPHQKDEFKHIAEVLEAIPRR